MGCVCYVSVVCASVCLCCESGRVGVSFVYLFVLVCVLPLLVVCVLMFVCS